MKHTRCYGQRLTRLLPWMLLLALMFPVAERPARADHSASNVSFESLRPVFASLDKGYRFREDALVTFSNGADYVIVNPLEPDEDGPVRVLRQYPQGAAVPDIIEFSDGHFLLKLVTLPNGRQSFPVVSDLPLHLRSGLLPQGFNFPPGFLLPTMWKSLTGDLLVSSDDEAKAKKSFPLAFIAPSASQGQDKAARWVAWDTAKNQYVDAKAIACDRARLKTSHDARWLFAGCQNEPTLYVFDRQAPASEPLRLTLPQSVSDMAVDEANHRVFLSHSTVNRLSVFNYSSQRLEDPVELARPASVLAISNFRHQLYATSVRTDEDRQAESETKAPPKSSFLRVRNPDLKSKVIYRPTIQLVNLNSRTMEQQIPAMPDVSLMFVQDEKVLWLVSATQSKLIGFDLRWQEYTSPIDLPSSPKAMDADYEWLYLLDEPSALLRRLDLKTYQWGPSIPLQRGSKPSHLVVDTRDHVAYVLSEAPAGIQVVNLNRAEWVGTQKTDFPAHGQLVWLIPENERPSRGVRIQFQDGRMLLRTSQKPLWEGSLSDLRDLVKSQTQSESQTEPSAPVKAPQ